MEEEASVRNLGRLESLIRSADGPAGMDLPRAPEVVNRRVRNLFRRSSPAPSVNGDKAPALSRRVRRLTRPFQPAFGLDEANDAIQPLALLQVGHDEGPLAAHALGIRLHLFQGSADMGGQVDLVDDKKV